MKKVFAIFVAVWMFCSLCACSAGGGVTEESSDNSADQTPESSAETSTTSAHYATFENLIASEDYLALENLLISGEGFASEDYLEAYKLLAEKDGVPEAKNLLENFYFFPSEIVETNRNGAYQNIYRWDDAGNLLEIVRKFGDTEHTQTYTYDGNTITWTNSTDNAVKVYTLDDNGNCLKSQTTNAGSADSTTEYTYDADGKLIKMTNSGSFSSLTTIVYTYDDNGNCIEKEWSNDAGEMVVNIYTYDANQNLVKDEQADAYADATELELFTRTYTYDDNQRLIKVDQSGDEYTCEVTYTYDDNGNCVREQATSTDATSGVIQYDNTWEFDEYGHFTKQRIEEKEETAVYVTTATVKSFKVFYIPDRAPALDELLPNFGQQFIFH